MSPFLDGAPVVSLVCIATSLHSSPHTVPVFFGQIIWFFFVKPLFSILPLATFHVSFSRFCHCFISLFAFELPCIPFYTLCSLSQAIIIFYFLFSPRLAIVHQYSLGGYTELFYHQGGFRVKCQPSHLTECIDHGWSAQAESCPRDHQPGTSWLSFLRYAAKTKSYGSVSLVDYCSFYLGLNWGWLHSCPEELN
jgi:hypothetical protein